MKIMHAKELKKRLAKDEVILIDVREPAEHRSECIDGACHIPLGQISIDALPSKAKAIVMHCRSGKRSADACIKLLQQDPSLELYSLEGGISAWTQEGFPVKKSSKQVLPLDRQTQLAAGFFAFTGTVLGAYYNALFYIVPGFVGAGLMFAGITGWCGLAKVLARMPWNQ